MGRITSLQNQVGALQKTLAERNKTIASMKARDKKILEEINKEENPDVVEKIKKLMS